MNDPTLASVLESISADHSEASAIRERLQRRISRRQRIRTHVLAAAVAAAVFGGLLTSMLFTQDHDPEIPTTALQTETIATTGTAPTAAFPNVIDVFRRESLEGLNVNDATAGVAWSKQGDLLLTTFSGSGCPLLPTTIVAIDPHTLKITAQAVPMQVRAEADAKPFSPPPALVPGAEITCTTDHAPTTVVISLPVGIIADANLTIELNGVNYTLPSR